MLKKMIAKLSNISLKPRGQFVKTLTNSAQAVNSYIPVISEAKND